MPLCSAVAMVFCDALVFGGRDGVLPVPVDFQTFLVGIVLLFCEL